METKNTYLKELEQVTGIKFIACESSNIEGYGHNPKTNQLWVAFKKNKVYVYENQTQANFEDLKNAPSKGKWVNKNLVKPKVKYEGYELKD